MLSLFPYDCKLKLYLQPNYGLNQAHYNSLLKMSTLNSFKIVLSLSLIEKIVYIVIICQNKSFSRKLIFQAISSLPQFLN